MKQSKKMAMRPLAKRGLPHGIKRGWISPSERVTIHEYVKKQSVRSSVFVVPDDTAFDVRLGYRIVRTIPTLKAAQALALRIERLIARWEASSAA
jgi:hypothetical protein